MPAPDGPCCCFPAAFLWVGFAGSGIVNACHSVFPVAASSATTPVSYTHLTLITQNVDGLHDLAGSKNVIKLHGDIWVVRCMACGGERVERSELNELPPRCACGGLLRPGVVWFGEAPVSYTHLDVYKRQASSRSAQLHRGIRRFYGEP